MGERAGTAAVCPRVRVCVGRCACCKQASKQAKKKDEELFFLSPSLSPPFLFHLCLFHFSSRFRRRPVSIFPRTSPFAPIFITFAIHLKSFQHW